jgi:hypothetical protein
MKKIWFKIRIRYAQLKQWYIWKFKKKGHDDDDNIYPFW